MFFRDLLRAIRDNPCRGVGMLAQLLHVEGALVESALAWLEDNRYVERQGTTHCARCPFPCGGRWRDGWILTAAGRKFLEEGD